MQENIFSILSLVKNFQTVITLKQFIENLGIIISENNKGFEYHDIYHKTNLIIHYRQFLCDMILCCEEKIDYVNLSKKKCAGSRSLSEVIIITI